MSQVSPGSCQLSSCAPSSSSLRYLSCPGRSHRRCRNSRHPPSFFFYAYGRLEAKRQKRNSLDHVLLQHENYSPTTVGQVSFVQKLFAQSDDFVHSRYTIKGKLFALNSVHKNKATMLSIPLDMMWNISSGTSVSMTNQEVSSMPYGIYRVLSVEMRF